jgi:hypothetical protein
MEESHLSVIELKSEVSKVAFNATAADKKAGPKCGAGSFSAEKLFRPISEITRPW